MNVARDDHLLKSQTPSAERRLSQKLSLTGLSWPSSQRILTALKARPAVHTWETGKLRLGHLPEVPHPGHRPPTSLWAALLLAGISF